METAHPQSNVYYSCVLSSFVVSLIGMALDICYLQPASGWFTWLWDFWAVGLVIQWLVYIGRMLQIRNTFRQSKKDGEPIIVDKGDRRHLLFKILIFVPWWATKIDNTAIDLIGREHNKSTEKARRRESEQTEEHEQHASL